MGVRDAGVLYRPDEDGHGSRLAVRFPIIDNQLEDQVRPLFRELRRWRDSLGLMHLSMGMSNDFEVAIEEGATLLRIGRAVFGERKG